MANDRVFPRALLLRELSAFARNALIAAFPAHVPARQAQRSDGQICVVLSEHHVMVIDTARGESREIVRIALEDVERGGASLLPANVGPGETVVMLPAAEALRRTVQLPVNAAGTLRNILRFELDRHSPIDPEQVHFDYWVKFRDKTANRLEVELRIVKRSSIDRAIRLSRSLGLEPISIEIEGDLFPLNGRDLPLNRAAVIRSLWRRWSTPALLALILVLLVSLIATVAARKELAASLLEARVEEARIKASSVQKVRDEIANAEKRAAFLAGEKRAPMAVHILSELTRAIPDGTWTYSFQLTGREVRVRGFSSSAFALIGAFDQSGFFTNAQFRAPLTQGPQSGMERFDLSADVKEATP